MSYSIIRGGLGIEGVGIFWDEYNQKYLYFERIVGEIEGSMLSC